MKPSDRIPLDLLKARLPLMSEFEPLGQGGFGAVYTVWDRGLSLRAALKVARVGPGEKDEIKPRERFLREVRILVRSSNVPGLVRVYRHGAIELEDSPGDALLWYTMELCQGSLQEALPTLPLPARVAAVHQLLEVLCFLEASGIAHRDLKPENVFLASRPPQPINIKLGDFGIARGTRRGEALQKTLTDQNFRLGSPVYMAPELFLAASEPDLLKADQYSTALVIQGALSAGRPPLAGSFSTLADMLRAKRQGLVPLVVPGYPLSGDALAPVVRCLRKMSDPDPDARYRNMVEAARSLRAAMALADLNP